MSIELPHVGTNLSSTHSLKGGEGRQIFARRKIGWIHGQAFSALFILLTKPCRDPRFPRWMTQFFLRTYVTTNPLSCPCSLAPLPLHRCRAGTSRPQGRLDERRHRHNDSWPCHHHAVTIGMARRWLQWDSACSRQWRERGSGKTPVALRKSDHPLMCIFGPKLPPSRIYRPSSDGCH